MSVERTATNVYNLKMQKSKEKIQNSDVQIVISTTNPGKIGELRATLGEIVKWLSLSNFPKIEPVEESGQTFAENARLKALGYANQTGLWAIADDSGLVIDALGGAPGVNSARFSGEKTVNEKGDLIDHRNIAKVLRLMQDIPPEKRSARFVCCLCLAAPCKVLLEAQGTIEGRILEREVGGNGFGYDPIFFVPSLNKTVAQMTSEEKNAISHRGNAIRKLKPKLLEILKSR
jgi:XTP/dITP diphosphohydrolase